LSKSANLKVCLRSVSSAEWWRHLRAESKHPACIVCVESGVKFNIWDIVSTV